jgi:hypothetical protein
MNNEKAEFVSVKDYTLGKFNTKTNTIIEEGDLI